MALNLPKLPRGVRLIDVNGGATATFQLWWQSFAKAIETHETYQDSIIDLQAATIAAQDAADTAIASATAADAAATAAQDTADALAAEANLVNSYVDGTPPVLTGKDAGTDAKITVASHTRVYGDGTTVAITGADVTGLSYSTTYFVYYVDATRADTTPTFLATTDAATAAQLGNTHLVGSVLTPAALAADNTGDAVAPAGVGSLYEFL